MNLTVDYNGKRYFDMEPEQLLVRGVPQEVIGSHVKKLARIAVSDFAETYRAKLASQSAGKLAEYRIKEEIARDPDLAVDAELELLSREAEARGTDRTGLIGQIKAQTVAFRQIALLIGALEAEANAAISTIADDDGDIEVAIRVLLGAAKGQADEAFTDALTLMRES